MSIDPDKCSSEDNVQHDSNNQVCDSDINYESDTKCNSDNSGKNLSLYRILACLLILNMNKDLNGFTSVLQKGVLLHTLWTVLLRDWTLC